jgi:hypothetical protein
MMATYWEQLIEARKMLSGNSLLRRDVDGFIMDYLKVAADREESQYQRYLEELANPVPAGEVVEEPLPDDSETYADQPELDLA